MFRPKRNRFVFYKFYREPEFLPITVTRIEKPLLDKLRRTALVIERIFPLSDTPKKMWVLSEDLTHYRVVNVVPEGTEVEYAYYIPKAGV